MRGFAVPSFSFPHSRSHNTSTHTSHPHIQPTANHLPTHTHRHRHSQKTSSFLCFSLLSYGGRHARGSRSMGSLSSLSHHTSSVVSHTHFMSSFRSSSPPVLVACGVSHTRSSVHPSLSHTHSHPLSLSLTRSHLSHAHTFSLSSISFLNLFPCRR